MSMNSGYGALRQYRTVTRFSGVEEANPHRLVQMLMEGAVSRLAMGLGNMERGELAAKGENIGRAISIIDGLRSALDREAGGDMARNMEGLYAYMMDRLLQANATNDPAVLSEVHGLLRELKAGWDSIGGNGGGAASASGDALERPSMAPVSA